MAIDSALKNKIKDYISAQLQKGFSYAAVEKVLVDRGYDKQEIDSIIDELAHEPLGARLKKAAPILIVSLLIIFGIIGFVWFMSSNVALEKCDTQACFEEYANKCEPALYEVSNEGTIYVFKSLKGCVFTKSVDKVSDDEPASIKDMFEGKDFICEYEQGGFDPRWVSSLLGGLDKCTGPLKEALYELTIMQYKKELGEY